MSTFNRTNWDQSVLKVGKRMCPECNVEMKYLGINLWYRPFIHLWVCPVDSLNHEYDEDLSDIEVAEIENYLAKQPRRPYHVRMSVDVRVQARHEKEAVSTFSKPYQDFFTKLSMDEGFSSIAIYVPDGPDK